MADEAYPLGYTGEKTKALLKKIDELEVGSLYPLSGGAVIPNGADLDDYTTVGVYIVTGSANAAALANCPYTASGFVLKVMSAGGAIVRQDLLVGSIGSNVLQFARSYNKTSGNWSAWLRYASTENVDSTASLSYSVTVPASAWAAGSLTYLGQTYTQKAAVTVAAAKGTGRGLVVEPTSGSAADLQAWGVVDVSAGKVTLWSKAALSGSITLRITEIR